MTAVDVNRASRSLIRDIPPQEGGGGGVVAAASSQLWLMKSLSQAVNRLRYPDGKMC